MRKKNKATMVVQGSADDLLKRAIGKTIKDTRNKLGHSALKVATELGISRVALTHIENGRNHINGVMLWKLACLFGCEVGYFLPATTKKYRLSNADLRVLEKENPSAVGWAEEVAGKVFNHGEKTI